MSVQLGLLLGACLGALLARQLGRARRRLCLCQALAQPFKLGRSRLGRRLGALSACLSLLRSLHGACNLAERLAHDLLLCGELPAVLVHELHGPLVDRHPHACACVAERRDRPLRAMGFVTQRLLESCGALGHHAHDGLRVRRFVLLRGRHRLGRLGEVRSLLGVGLGTLSALRELPQSRLRCGGARRRLRSARDGAGHARLRVFLARLRLCARRLRRGGLLHGCLRALVGAREVGLILRLEGAQSILPFPLLRLGRCLGRRLGRLGRLVGRAQLGPRHHQLSTALSEHLLALCKLESTTLQLGRDGRALLAPTGRGGACIGKLLVERPELGLVLHAARFDLQRSSLFGRRELRTRSLGGVRGRLLRSRELRTLRREHLGSVLLDALVVLLTRRARSSQLGEAAVDVFTVRRPLLPLRNLRRARTRVARCHSPATKGGGLALRGRGARHGAREVDETSRRGALSRSLVVQSEPQGPAAGYAASLGRADPMELDDQLPSLAGLLGARARSLADGFDSVPDCFGGMGICLCRRCVHGTLMASGCRARLRCGTRFGLPYSHGDGLVDRLLLGGPSSGTLRFGDACGRLAHGALDGAQGGLGRL
eukprot:jgi/Chrpa1/8475/Chrysochromulina_OHIO_Genome00021743-RA